MPRKQTYKAFAETLSKRGRNYADTLVDKGILDHIGSGVGRSAYTHKNWPFLVFKIEFHEEPKMNQSEWEYWNKSNKKQKQFLAKPYYLSKNGFTIVMERVGSYFPKPIPRKIWNAMEKTVGDRMWDCEEDHNIGPSGTLPKLFDYADQRSTWWFEDGDYEPGESYYTDCSCPQCAAIRKNKVK